MVPLARALEVPPKSQEERLQLGETDGVRSSRDSAPEFLPVHDMTISSMILTEPMTPFW